MGKAQKRRIGKQEAIVFSNHGSLCSSVGPVVDVKMKCKVFYREKFVATQMREVLPAFSAIAFLPSVYDGLFLMRPLLSFRDGTVIKNCMVDFTEYLTELPFNHSYLFSLVHLIGADYKSMIDCQLDR